MGRLLLAALALSLVPAASLAQTLVPLQGQPRIQGPEPGRQLGLAHAVGDLDCDGRADLAVSLASPPAVLIWSGIVDPSTPWPGPDWADLLPATDADLVVHGDDPSFGAALATGDLGGACDALVVGAPADRLGMGAVYVLHGPLPTDCAGPCSLDAETSFSLRIDGSALGALGAAVAVVGDLDGRDHDDLILGEPAFSLPSGNARGRALAFSRGLGALSGQVRLTLDADFAIEGTPGQRVAAQLQAADIDGDGVSELLLPGGGDVLLLHDLSNLPLVTSFPDLAAQLTRHHGHVLSATLPFGVQAGSPQQRVLWVGEPSWFFGVGAVVALLPDSQGRFDQSREQSSVRIEGGIGADGLFGSWIDTADLSGDGLDELIVTSPLWSDGDGTVQGSIGPRAGMTWVVDGGSIPALLDQICVPAPCGFVVNAVADFGLSGTQGYEGSPSAASAVSPLNLRAAGIARRILVFSPLLDDAVAGIDSGGVRALAVDADEDGALLGEDCDDFEPTVFPGAPPLCDGVPDQDCDGLPDANQRDRDGDGVTLCDGDCDDEDRARAPGLPELWCDGLDNDCLASPEDAFEQDRDGDSVMPCEGDCDDLRSDRAPGAPERCNGLDDDCDDAVDEDFDQDGDGFPADSDPACEGRPDQSLDCDDADPARHPGAPEGGALLDSDCDGAVSWQGGCACATHGPRSRPPLLLLLVLLGLRRRRGVVS